MPDRFFDFPLGLRPWPNPQRLRRPLLKEGYLLEPLEETPNAYRLTAILGANKIQHFIEDFARLLPDEAFFVLEFYDLDRQKENQESDQPSVFHSCYLPTTELVEILTPYLPRLIHDGFVGFGLANNQIGLEIFCSEEKVFTCFTDNHLRITNLFARHGLPHRQHLLLPSDFGHDHLSLLCHHRLQLPPLFASLSPKQLDYRIFCHEIIEALEMYEVEDSLSFFLTRQDQQEIIQRLEERPEFKELTNEDFGALIFDWRDFVNACEEGFEGSLDDYQYGLELRDLLQFVSEGVSSSLQQRLESILDESDKKFQALLLHQEKRIDPPTMIPMRAERFWCHGVIANQGAHLRRDLIRCGWYRP